MTRPVVVFRERLFVPSEEFIYAQARALKRFSPIIAGRELAGTPATDLDVVTLASKERIRHVLIRSHSSLTEQLQPRDPALVHAHFAVDGVYANCLASSLGIPLIVTLHGSDVTMKPRAMVTARKPALLQYMARRRELIRCAQLFICVSGYVRTVAIARGFPADRTVILPTGIPTPPAFAPTQGTGANRVIHVARLVENKGTANLIAAVAHVAQSGVDVTLDIVGEGPLRCQLERQTEVLGIHNRVTWHRSLPNRQVLDLMSASSLLCIPSQRIKNGTSEGFGMVMLEAASRGVPLVGTNTGGIPEFIRNGTTGLLVPPRDSAALATAIRRVLASPDLASHLAENAFTEMKLNHDIVVQASRLEQLYETATNSEGAPSL